MMNTPSQLPKPSPASTALLTLSEVEAGITARTIEEAIAAPTFAHAVKSIGRPQMSIVIGKAITRGMGYFAEHQRLSTEAVVLWADLLLDEYPHESLADLSVFLRGAALGRYGQEQRDGSISRKGETFGELSIVKLNTWFAQYLGEKADVREREAKAEKGRYLAAGRELHPAVAAAIKPVVAKVCAEQHAKRDAAMLEARMKNLTRQLPVMTDQDLRDHYKLVATDAEKTAITDEAGRRGLLKQPVDQPAETPTAQ